MKARTPKIAIIGSGATAISVAKVLYEAQLNFDLISPCLAEVSSKNQNGKKLILKDRKEKSYVYSDSRFSHNFKQVGTEILETTFFGGLTEIWGGVTFPNLGPFNPIPFFSKAEILEGLEVIKGFVSLDSTDSEIFKAFLGEIEIGASLSSAPTIARNPNGSKWNASQSWNSIPRSSYTLIDGIALSISEENGQAEVRYLDFKKNILCAKYDEVFVAAGPFGNAKLILNSNLDLTSLKLKDSKVVNTLCLGKRQRVIPKEMTPSRCLIVSNSDENVYTQIYPISNQLVGSIRFKFARNLLRSISSITGSRLLIAMTFLASSESDSIELRRITSGFAAKDIKSKKVRSHFKTHLRKALFAEGILKTPFSIVGKPGSGVHSGAFIVNRQDLARKGIVNPELGSWKRIHFVGTSNFEFVPSGPVTLTAMIHAVLVTREVLEL